jgi:ArsR family transcriptional regulator, arsenate/arsenite/antimonite-responsive transcriptional repressor
MVEFPGDLRVDGPPLVSRPVRCNPAGNPLPPGEARSAAVVFEALSDPVRVRMLWLLEAAPDGSADLAGSLGIAAEAVSAHLAVLVGCGLVRRRGAPVGYEVVVEKVTVVRRLLGGT